MTQKTLIARRKSEQRPHLSFDLDGDGQVSAKEYVLAQNFDEDKDGILNSEEKKKAI